MMEFLGSPALTNFLLVIMVFLLVLNVWVTDMLTAVEYQGRGGLVANTIHRELLPLGKKLDEIVKNTDKHPPERYD